MGFRFRKSIKLAPGVRLNVSKKGISSVSIGRNGARVNIGKKGTRSTIGIPKTGLSYSSYRPYQKTANRTRQPLTSQPRLSEQNASHHRAVSLALALGIFLLPIIFAWFTLRQDHSTLSRVVSFIWLILFVLAWR